MDLEQARRIVREEQPNWQQLCFAAGVLATSSEATFLDLLACLHHRGLPAEGAACALYVRTKRPRHNVSPLSVITDYTDWSEYLDAHGFVTK